MVYHPGIRKAIHSMKAMNVAYYLSPRQGSPPVSLLLRVGLMVVSS